MIPQSLYFSVFLTFVLLIVTVRAIPQGNNRLLSPEPSNVSMRKAFMLGIVLILYFGLRPTGIYDSNGRPVPIGDTPVYVSAFNRVASGALPEDEGIISQDGKLTLGASGFYLIRNVLALSGLSDTLWLIVVAIIYIVPIIFALKRLTPNSVYPGFLFCIVSLGFYGFGTNGLKSGDAASIFLLGLSFIAGAFLYKRSHKTLFIALGLIICSSSYLFHSSLLMAIGALILSLTIVKSTKFAIVLWIMSVLITLVFGNSLALFANEIYDDPELAEYVDPSMTKDSGWSSYIRFRWDFLIYSALPILFGWYIVVKRQLKDKCYQLILNTYILTNCIFVIFMYSSFPNRFAAVSWSILPLVLYYPLVKYNVFGDRQNTYAGYMLFAQLILVALI